MRRYRGPGGDERLWLEPAEIEDICEDELRKAGLLPSAEDPVVDVERFIEGHLGAELDQYAILDSDVLGVTEFRPGEVPLVRINSDLTGSAMDADWVPPGVHGRWRATVAHEAAHVVLHRALFELNPDQGELFGGGGGGQRMMRCLKRQVSFLREVRDWREVQANRAMASLLMPRPVFLSLARTESQKRAPNRLRTGSSDARELTDRLASLFAVSRQAAAIRTKTLGFLADPEAPELVS